jgi:hypothetical protein
LLSISPGFLAAFAGSGTSLIPMFLWVDIQPALYSQSEITDSINCSGSHAEGRNLPFFEKILAGLKSNASFINSSPLLF